MSTVVNQDLVLRFARWGASNGGDIRGFTKLIEAAQAKSPVIGGRIENAVSNSSLAFRQDLWENMKPTFNEDEMHQIFTMPKTGPYDWQ